MCSTESLYFRLGGEVALRDFVDYLYDFMDTAPEVVQVRKMQHAVDQLDIAGILLIAFGAMILTKALGGGHMSGHQHTMQQEMISH